MSQSRGLISNSNGSILTKLSGKPQRNLYNNSVERFLQVNPHVRDIDHDPTLTEFLRSSAQVSVTTLWRRCEMGGRRLRREKSFFLSQNGGLISNSNGPIVIKLSGKPQSDMYSNSVERFLQENPSVRDIDPDPRFSMHFSMISTPARMTYCKYL